MGGSAPPTYSSDPPTKWFWPAIARSPPNPRNAIQQGPQGEGGTADHRGDLFDLAQTLYLALTGEAAHASLGTDANGQATAPAKLPGHLKSLQPVLDQALAADPNRRFQTGAAFREALDAVARSGALADLSIKTAAVSSGEIRAVGEAAGLSSREPSRDERGAYGRAAGFPRWLLAAGLAAVLIGGAVYLVERQSWRLVAFMAQIGLAEDPNVQSAWVAAQALREDPVQNLASLVASYRRVLELDASHGPATQAIASLADQWRQDIVQALAQNDLGSAEAKLNEMTLVFPDDYSLVDLGGQISNRRAADTLLASTRSLLRSQGMSRIPAATVAIQAYQEIVRLAPGHPAALAELAALAEHYAELARQAAGQGDVDGAIVYLERAATADGGLPVLEAVREEIQQPAAPAAPSRNCCSKPAPSAPGGCSCIRRGQRRRALSSGLGDLARQRHRAARPQRSDLPTAQQGHSDVRRR